MVDFDREYLENAIFVVDDSSEEKQEVQGRDFLFTGVEPVIGQRVDLSFVPGEGRAHFFVLSGQVMQILPEPEEVSAMQDCNDCGLGKKGSCVISADILPLMVAKHKFGALGDGEEFEGSPFSDLSEWKWMKPYCSECGIHTVEYSQVPEKNFEGIYIIYKTRWGVLHGQEVICEGRLHFDQDMKRAQDEGPWSDGIPFDGRDIWQFTLVFNDTRACKWVLKPDSLVNLGRDRHPRCWPWTMDDELPYQRDGVDRYNPRALPYGHLCIGPMGCNGTDHCHMFDGGAA